MYFEASHVVCPVAHRKCRPLWAFEEITSKVHHIKSSDSLQLLLSYFVRIFTETLPSAHIVQRWAQDAIHLALSCSSRHYAGRSFQVSLSVCPSVCLSVRLSVCLSVCLLYAVLVVVCEPTDLFGFCLSVWPFGLVVTHWSTPSPVSNGMGDHVRGSTTSAGKL